MTKDYLQHKILELNPAKEYVITVGKNSGLFPEDLAQIVVENRKVIFLMVDDVNQVKLQEVKDFEVFVDMLKKQNEKV